MKNILIWLFILVLMFGFSADKNSQTTTFRLPNGVTTNDYIPNTLVIKLKDNTNLKNIKNDLNNMLLKNGINLTNVESIFPSNTNPESELYRTQINPSNFNQNNYLRVNYSSKQAIEKVINILLKNKNISYAEPSYIYHTEFVPNDSYYHNQFFLPQVNAPQAWDINRNALSVVIGIVDTGSETTHEDLAANIYLNTADPINGIDDDGDGYVDNYYGWDFCGASASTMIPDNDPNVKNAAADHGVHVSGIASAVSNNAKGVASIAGNAKLLIVKAGADDKPTAIYKGYEGIKYAADMGTPIINCSWGGPGGGQFGQEIIDYAVAKGCLIVAAAGNSANDIPIYPAAFEGVLAVANLKPDDVKGPYSNWGTYVDISAPGEGILSTTFNNTYTSYSGTSMASPLVASAAALIKSYYPSLTGLQIGELLRATADNIDTKNLAYAGLLGKGRLNVYRALTENAFAIRYQNLKIIDQNLGNRAPNTVVTLQFDLKNFLNPINDLNLEISSNTAFVQVIDNQLALGNFSNGQTKTSNPIRIKILPNAPDNLEVTFSLKYIGNGGTFIDYERFKEIVALDYLNVTVNKISTTFSSNGRVGYSKANADGGLGFIYRDENMLYEAALMIAKSDVQVSNNARFDAGYSNDFKRVITAAQETNNQVAFEGISTFNDQNSAFPIGVQVQSKLLALNTTGNDKYVIVEYEISNQSNEDLSNIYTGLFTDWDLDESSFNATEYDTATKLAYAYAKKNASYPYTGIKLLSLKASPAYYPLSYQISNSFLADNIFSLEEKYKTLTSGIQSSGLGYDTANGYDIMFTIGSGPYQIAKNKRIKVAYAFVAGDNLEDLKKVGENAQKAYEILNPQTIIPNNYYLSQNYPNEAKNSTKIKVGLPHQSNLQLNLYDTNGKKVKTITHQNYEEGTYVFDVDLTGLSRGVYIYEMIADKFKERKKMIVSN